MNQYKTHQYLSARDWLKAATMIFSPAFLKEINEPLNFSFFSFLILTWGAQSNLQTSLKSEKVFGNATEKR